MGSGYAADVCLCRSYSRGQLTLTSADPRVAPNIDLGLLSDSRDMDLLVAGFKRLRELLAAAPFESRRASEVYPVSLARADDGIVRHIRDRIATAYHPLGTLAMGDDAKPVTPGIAASAVSIRFFANPVTCLLYTSDAADE